jgi:uncharacterized sporulation protein YeaH/YhbH (DUF444 family)
MTQIIDRRLNGRHKSAVNRQRFLTRYKKYIKSSVNDAINKRKITDIDTGETIVIPAKDIREPIFRIGMGGKKEFILPGNKEFLSGDRLPKPATGAQGVGSGGSNSGAGTDDFVFQISKEEFLNLYFEDLALPDLVKKQLTQIPIYKVVRAGYTTTGVPTNINILRSLRGALSRRIAIASGYKNKLKLLEDALLNLDKNNENEFKKISDEIVMFCIMDVSGSMDKLKKDIAKRFFILLYLFLKRNYQKIDVVFIRHHTSAKEVNEEDFFYSRETGGTVVSSALQLLKKIIDERYDPSYWNIYAAQASDGDNWNADSPHCYEVLTNEIMPYMQYFAYVEIMPRLHQSLWEAYLKIKLEHENFAMQTINDLTDIYPVFRELFKNNLASIK